MSITEEDKKDMKVWHDAFLKRKEEPISFRAWMKKSEEEREKVVKSLLLFSRTFIKYGWWRERSKEDGNETKSNLQAPRN